MRAAFLALLLVLSSSAQEKAPAPEKRDTITVPSGTRIPLQLINRISTKNAHVGDQVYLQTAFPITVSDRVVIPPGSYVRGTITQVKRPGRVHGRGELFLRFDALTLANGVTRSFTARVGAVEGSGSETLERKEGKIQSDTARGHDAATVATTGAAGASVGSIAGASSGHTGLGAGLGAAAGAAAGLAAVLLTRGPDAVLERGSTVDMVLDRELVYHESELPLTGGMMPPLPILPSSGAPGQSQRNRPTLPGSRWPY